MSVLDLTPKPFACAVCRRRFLAEADLYEHGARKRHATGQPARKSVCTCGRAFWTREQLEHHAEAAGCFVREIVA